MRKTFILIAILGVSILIFSRLPSAKNGSNPPPVDASLLPYIGSNSPSPQIVKMGSAVEFSVSATGGTDLQPLRYEWTFQPKSGRREVPLSATGPTLSRQGLKLDDSGFYTVQVRNSFGKTPQKFELTVVPLERPKILSPNRSQIAIKRGQKEVVEISVSGDGNLTYAWEFQKAGVGQWSPIKGATENRLIIEKMSDSKKGKYRFIATNSEGIAQSEFSVEMAELDPPEIKTDLEPKRSAKEWDDLVLQLDAIGEGEITYQLEFKKNSSDKFEVLVARQKENQFTLRKLDSRNKGFYRIAVFNESDKSVESQTLSLSIEKAEAPSFDISNPNPKTFKAKIGHSIKLHVPMTSTGNAEFFWERWSDDSGWNRLQKAHPSSINTQNGELEIQNMSKNLEGRYRLTASNLTSVVTSPDVQLEVAPFDKVSFTGNPKSGVYYVGETLEIKVSVSGDRPITTTWQYSKDGKTYDDLDIEGETLVLSNIKKTNSGYYRAKGKNPNPKESLSDPTLVIVKPFDVVIDIIPPERDAFHILYNQRPIDVESEQSVWGPFVAALTDSMKSNNVRVRIISDSNQSKRNPSNEKIDGPARKTTEVYKFKVTSISGVAYVEDNAKARMLSDMTETTRQKFFDSLGEGWSQFFAKITSAFIRPKFYPKMNLNAAWQLEKRDGEVLKSGFNGSCCIGKSFKMELERNGELPKWQKVLEAAKGLGAFPIGDSARDLAREVSKSVASSLEQIKEGE